MNITPIPETLLGHVSFQSALYNDEKNHDIPFLSDYCFMCGELTWYLKIRPFDMDRIIRFCQDHRDKSDFVSMFLRYGLIRCPILIFRLKELGFYSDEEVRKKLKALQKFKPCFYFYDIIDDFKTFTNGFVPYPPQSISMIKSYEGLKSIFSFGFAKGSIGYCLKYDDIEVFRELASSPSFNQEGILDWSYFEWSKRPFAQDYLSVSAYFGSINVFKSMIVNNFNHNISHARSAFCGSNMEIIHFFASKYQPITQFIESAIMYSNEALVHWISPSNDIELFKDSNHHFLKLLIYMCNEGIEINESNKSMVSPLHHVSKQGSLEIAKYLVDYGADIRALDYFLWTPFFYAVKHGHLHIVDYLYSLGADIEDTDHDGRTPIFYAIKHHHLEIVKYLVERGASFDIHDYYDQTPIDFALEQNNAEIFNLLPPINKQ